MLLTSVPSLQPYIYNQKRPNIYLLSGHNRLALHVFLFWLAYQQLPHVSSIQVILELPPILFHYKGHPSLTFLSLCQRASDDNSLASALLIWLPFIHMRGKPSLFHILYSQIQLMGITCAVFCDFLNIFVNTDISILCIYRPVF